MTTLQPRPKSAIKPSTGDFLNTKRQAAEPSSRKNFKVPTLSQLLAVTAGITLTLASAATNFTYATAKFTADHDRAIWGGVAVAASVILALAPSALLKSLRARSWGAAFVSLVAVVIFGGYSLAAALGNATGGRMVASLDADDAAKTRIAAIATIETKTKELSAIAPTRTVQELQAELDKLEGSRKDLNDCMGWLPNTNARAVCIQIADVKAEAGRAQRRADIEAAIATARQAVANQPARSTVANTDAVALQGFASALGFNVTTDTLNRLLVLMAVLVIEFGGGLAFAVAGSLGRADADEATVQSTNFRTQPAQTPQTPFVDTTPLRLTHSNSGRSADANANTADTIPLQPVPVVSKDAVADRLLAVVREHGGELRGSVRKIASKIGAKPATLHTAALGLVSAGALAMDVSRSGTVFKLN